MSPNNLVVTVPPLVEVASDMVWSGFMECEVSILIIQLLWVTLQFNNEVTNAMHRAVEAEEQHASTKPVMISFLCFH